LVDDAHPLRIRVPAQGTLRKDSDLLLDQLRAIDNQRFIEGSLTRLTAVQLRSVARAIQDVMDLR
jgi:mRNA interferase MazF